MSKSDFLYNYQTKGEQTRYKRKTVNKWRLFRRDFVRYSKKLLLVFLFVFLVFLGYKYVFESDYFRVQHIEITGTKNFVNADELRNLAKEHSDGKYLISVDVDKIKLLSEETFLGAKNIDVKKIYPNTIQIDVQERVPLAVASGVKDDDYYLVDEDGYVLGIVDVNNTNLPQVTYNGPLRVGYFIDKDLIPLYMSLIGSLDAEGLKSSSISIEKKYIKFFVDDGIQILLSREKDIPNSVTIVSNLYKQLALEGKKINKIDLRYDKVVVQYDNE